MDVQHGNDEEKDEKDAGNMNRMVMIERMMMVRKVMMMMMRNP